MDTERAPPSSVLISAVVRYWHRRSQIEKQLQRRINVGAGVAIVKRSCTISYEYCDVSLNYIKLSAMYPTLQYIPRVICS